MRDAITPSALLFAAVGLALAFAPRSAWLPSLCALACTLAVFFVVSLPRGWVDAYFLGCSLSVIVTAGSIQIFRNIAASAAVALSINTGVWVSALAGAHLHELAALPCLLFVLPSAWVTRRHGPIQVKITSSWLIAIAALTVLLQFLPVTPGYIPDHLE
jgi:hypothetical protein